MPDACGHTPPTVPLPSQEMLHIHEKHHPFDQNDECKQGNGCMYNEIILDAAKWIGAMPQLVEVCVCSPHTQSILLCALPLPLLSKGRLCSHSRTLAGTARPVCAHRPSSTAPNTFSSSRTLTLPSHPTLSPYPQPHSLNA